MIEIPNIYQAETDRVAGRYWASLEQGRLLGKIPLDELHQLPDVQLAAVMRAWRIWTNSLSSIYKSQWNGKNAAQPLFEARDVIQTYYYDEFSREKATQMSEPFVKDENGNEYQLAAEMCRYKGKYLLNVAQLIGNNVYITLAASSFDQAIMWATESTSAWAVATMERQIVGKHPDVTPKSEPIDFDTFTYAYETAAEIGRNSGSWDRVAAISWWYAREASLVGGRSAEFSKGISCLKEAASKLNKPWVEYPLGDLAGRALGISRRLSRDRANDEKLALNYPE